MAAVTIVTAVPLTVTVARSSRPCSSCAMIHPENIVTFHPYRRKPNNCTLALDGSF
jgi:hypothetical protein